MRQATKIILEGSAARWANSNNAEAKKNSVDVSSPHQINRVG
jgi:hypothetical protein